MLVLLADGWTDGWSTMNLFCVYRSSWRDPLGYIRLFGHVLGHANWEHFLNNMLLLLVVGPPMEEKYGSIPLLKGILFTALVTGVLQCILFPHTGLLGASGIVFMLIMLSSLAGFSGGIPVTMLLVAALYFGQQVYDIIFVHDNVANFMHIVGGLLIRKIKCSFDLSDCLEFTVEAGRPDSITYEKLKVLRQHGISRISINPQTMKQETLKLIGRHHTVEQMVESFHMARELGFDNINMDLIMGLPEETLDDVRRTMEQVAELAPDNLTVHSLALKRAARLNMFKEDYKDYKIINTQEHMDLVADCAAQMGLFPYYLYRQKGMAGNLENVGYAKEGMAGVYNVLIMEEKQTIVACGAGASTKRVWTEPNPDGTHRIERAENVKDVAQYIARIDEMIERKKKLFAEE